ncbi:MAG TPA: 2-oxoacid:acceptor oxidoreductase family protein [Acidimicrobiia bacterium]|jgi:Pyruvate/2-oxoacid:ferredoxin oxidoreductase gamma subunit
MERELLMSGIGGQGVQLAAEVLARAAITHGLEVQLFGSYGGMMRGGNTEATLVLADAPIEAPPTVASSWSAIAMHPEYAHSVVPRVRSGGLLFVNTTVFDSMPAPAHLAAGVRVVPLAATAIAADIGNVMAASIVMIGAYAAVTELVTLDALVAAIAQSLPPYRAQHIALNQHALRAGYDAAPDRSADEMAAP